MSPARPVEADLQAYVDGRLDAARAAVLEAWLAAHRGDGVRLAAYRQLGREWREAYASVLVEPVPRELLAEHVPDVRAPVYYFAGPPGMTMAVQGTLKELGVSEDDMRSEEFYGY